MGIQIKDTFTIAAPIGDVWQFLLTPERVVTCMPGAELKEKVDEETFIGTIKVKVGPIVAKYNGQVRFGERDESTHTVRLTAEGREDAGSGTARGGMGSVLREISATETEVSVESDVEVTGRVMQFGRGMIEGVSQQLFQQFVTCARSQLEESAAAAAEGREPVLPEEKPNEPIKAIPLVLKVIWNAIVSFFRRLFGRGKKE